LSAKPRGNSRRKWCQRTHADHLGWVKVKKSFKIWDDWS